MKQGEINGVNIGRLSRLKYKLVYYRNRFVTQYITYLNIWEALSGILSPLLVCHFKLTNMTGGGIREFVCDADVPACLKRELVGFGVDRYWQVRVHGCTRVPLPSHMF